MVPIAIALTRTHAARTSSTRTDSYAPFHPRSWQHRRRIAVCQCWVRSQPVSNNQRRLVGETQFIILPHTIPLLVSLAIRKTTTARACPNSNSPISNDGKRSCKAEIVPDIGATILRHRLCSANYKYDKMNNYIYFFYIKEDFHP